MQAFRLVGERFLYPGCAFNFGFDLIKALVDGPGIGQHDRYVGLANFVQQSSKCRWEIVCSNEAGIFRIKPALIFHLADPGMDARILCCCNLRGRGIKLSQLGQLTETRKVCRARSLSHEERIDLKVFIQA